MQMNKQPLVSVVIPCYNHESFVQDSIQSVIDQTYENIELIIIDDGSKDGSVEKIQEMIPACQERFIRFEFRYRPNKGLSATLNEGIDWAKGKYWTTCSSDDFYHEDKIFSQVDYLENNYDKKFCITKSFVVNDLNAVLDNETLQYNLCINESIKFNDVFTFKVHLPVTGMYDRAFLTETLNNFDISLSAEDYDMNLKILAKTNIGVIAKKLYFYRSPQALGRGRVRMAMRVDVSESHLLTIFKYKSHPEYNKALLEWNFRRFIYFSSYIKTKKYAFYGMLLSLRKISSVFYWKALFRLIFFWKNG